MIMIMHIQYLFIVAVSVCRQLELDSSLPPDVRSRASSCHSVRAPPDLPEQLDRKEMTILPPGQRVCLYLLTKSEISHGLVFMSDNIESYHKNSNRRLFNNLISH